MSFHLSTVGGSSDLVQSSGFSQLVHGRDETRTLLWWNELMNITL